MSPAPPPPRRYDRHPGAPGAGPRPRIASGGRAPRGAPGREGCLMGGRTRFGCTLGLALVLVPLADAKERGPDAKQGYRDLVALTTPDGAPANPAAWPAALVDGTHGSSGTFRESQG